MPAPSPVYMETVKELALDLLRAAVMDAEEGSPLFGLHIPTHRFGSVDSGKWPVLEARVGDDDGRGVSRQAPDFAVVADLVFDGIVASGRDEAGDLDLQTSLLVQAICDALLEDQSFLATFSHVMGIRRQREDATASIKGGGEFDAVVFRITFTVGFRESYTPRLPAPAATTLGITVDVGPDPTLDDPDQRHLVEASITTEA